eukprot:gene28628-35517_t
MDALQDYLKAHPNTKIVDPVEHVRKVISRSRTQPKYVLINEKDNLSTDDVLNLLSEKGISFPIICKPVEACGTANSHKMVVIVHPDDIHLLGKLRSCVVQQYYNHDGNLYKVYVIDSDVMAFKRASLPNIDISSHSTSSKRSFADTNTSTASPTSTSMDLSTSLTTVDICEDISCSLRKKKSSHGMFRSVEFDSRQQYPTLLKFLGTEDSVAVKVSSHFKRLSLTCPYFAPQQKHCEMSLD